MTIWMRLGQAVGRIRNKGGTLARAAFLLAVGISALTVISNDRVAIGEALSRSDPGLISLALVASLANIALTWVSWRLLLSDAPEPLSWRTSGRVFFLGQMGKYLPGSIWSYLASAELAKQAGMARTTAVSSLLLAVLIGLGTGIMLSLAILPEAIDVIAPTWRIVLIAGSLAGFITLALPPVKAFVLRMARIDYTISSQAFVLSSLVAAIAWICAGAQILLLAKAIGLEVSGAFLIEATGMYALAWVAGFLFFIAPAGLGAREGVLVGLLATQLPFADALVIALLARVITTLADFVLGGAALLIRPFAAAPAVAPHPHQG